MDKKPEDPFANLFQVKDNEKEIVIKTTDKSHKRL